MKIFFLGDIVGRSGRSVIKNHLPKIIEEFTPDLVIANAENLAGGKGTNRKTITEMMQAGIDAFTGGNHSFAIAEGHEIFERNDLPIVRPANFPEGTPGVGWKLITGKSQKRLLLINVLGRNFMAQHMDCPFRSIEAILAHVPREDYDASLIDVHAEATSEKQALRWAFDGRVSAVIGTHTHVPTADADVSDQGTAFQADSGMNGSLDSCIGVKKEIIIKKYLTQLPVTNELMHEGRMQMNGVLIEIDDMGRAMKIEHLRKVV
jgi:polar amino acid transport system substrate-binding protein